MQGILMGQKIMGLCVQFSCARTSFSTSLISTKLQISATPDTAATEISNQSVTEQAGIATGN
jgi:hypothetical protein